MKGLSVIICCYNSGNKLIPTLLHLAKQQSIANLPYELILIDNNCTDNTIVIATEQWRLLNTPFHLTIVQEPKAGLNYARETGIENALYEYVILCDDDNWLCENYLVNVYHLFEAMPAVALIGGVGEAVFETTPPVWFTALNGFGYAVGNEGRSTGYVDSLYGAGMGIRKTVLTEILNEKFSFILTDRTGTNLASGGDTEICILVKKSGYKIYLDNSLTFKHFLSSYRLQWGYYLRLRRSFGKAAAYLQLYSDSFIQDNQLHKGKKIKQFLSLAKFMAAHLKYILFPYFYKNADCANFVQQMNMRLTSLLENKKMKVIAMRIATGIKEKRVLLWGEKL